MSSASKSSGNKGQKEKGGFVLGLIIGLLLGLSIALGVALYINKTPIPFVNKVPQRTAEQDAAETERNKNWDPNAPLAGKAGRSASGVVNGAGAAAPATTPAPAPAQTTAPTAPATPTPAPAASAAKPAAPKAETPKAEASAVQAAEPYVYFVQAGAFTRPEEAEAQKAKLAIQGFTANVMEREQSGRTVFRVRLGPMNTRDEAESLQKKIEGAGFEANLVRVQR